MIRTRHTLAATLAAAALTMGVHPLAMAQTPVLTSAPLQNVAQLSASGTVEVQQDLLTLTLSTTREGADATAVQNQLRQALETALAEARRAAVPGQLDVRTGNFSLYPRHNKDGKISGWQGTTELVLEGRDFPRIAATAGRIQTLTLAGTSFGLSREARAKVEGDARAQAIESFKAQASAIARNFGFSSYSLREVSVSSSDAGVPRPRVMMMEMQAKAASDAAVPVEAGKALVQVSVSGSVQMQ